MKISNFFLLVKGYLKHEMFKKPSIFSTKQKKNENNRKNLSKNKYEKWRNMKSRNF